MRIEDSKTRQNEVGEFKWQTDGIECGDEDGNVKLFHQNLS